MNSFNSLIKLVLFVGFELFGVFFHVAMSVKLIIDSLGFL